MQISENRTHSVFNSPTGNSHSLSGFFNGKMGVGRSFCTFFHIFPNWVRCFGSKNRIVLWGDGVFREWFNDWEAEI